MGILVELIRYLPNFIRYALSLILFWPSIIVTRFFTRVWPERYRLWDKATPSGHLLVGSAPVLRSDLRRLKEQGVTHVVNLCWEWGGDPAYCEAIGLRHLHLPTLDFDPPTWKDALRGANFICDALKGGGRCLVHCKAGKGRSVLLVLCYLVLHEEMKPRAADAQLRANRPQISRKWSLPLVQAMESLALANVAAPASAQRARGSADGGGAPAADDIETTRFVPLPEERDREKERLALRSLGKGGDVV